jgi:hypothetical protein
MGYEEPNETELDALIRMLEAATARHPSEYWRYEILANAYLLRAEMGRDVHGAKRDARAAEQLRRELDRHPEYLLFEEGADRSGSPCERETVPYSLERIEYRPERLPPPPPVPHELSPKRAKAAPWGWASMVFGGLAVFIAPFEMLGAATSLEPAHVHAEGLALPGCEAGPSVRPAFAIEEGPTCSAARTPELTPAAPERSELPEPPSSYAHVGAHSARALP